MPVHTLIDFAAPGGASPHAALRCAFGAPLQVLAAQHLDEVVPLLHAVQALARQGRWCVGLLRYEAAPAFDAALCVPARQPGDGPLAWFGVHAQALPWPAAGQGLGADNRPEPVRAHWEDWAEEAAAEGGGAPPARFSRPDFERQMARIHAAIEAGALYQLNYSAPLHGHLEGSAWAHFLALRRAQPGGFAAYLDLGEEQILSLSPELFFDWDGEHILSCPMKGTAPRGHTRAEDATAAASLRASAKERAENVMIVDLVRNDLARIAQPFSVQVPRLFQLQALPSVWQMSSQVQARTRAGTTLAEVMAALFPCGSVTGAPKVQAMRMIRDLEPQARGVYCGAVGVLRPGGSATFNVAIRTVQIQGGRARCGIGSGITADASADGEWQEWQHKRAFLDRASQAFDLLQTLALDQGQWRDLPAHLDRMAQAAAHFGYPWSEAALLDLLAPLRQTHSQGRWRVQLRLDATGRPQASATALAAPDAVPVRLRLAPRALTLAHSEFVRFKTSRRQHYEALSPREPGIFDTVLWNPQGELTECTRGHLALCLDGRWYTPPLRCGLLDGVGRARWLRAGRLEEAVLRREDLARASGLAFINSLRGWLDAVLV